MKAYVLLSKRGVSHFQHSRAGRRLAMRPTVDKERADGRAV